MRRCLALMIILTLGLPAAVAAQDQPGIEELKKSAVKVYIDCALCDLDFIKNEITFVNYVRDRLEAQVHVLITTQTTGGGGQEYTLTFLGQNEFKDVHDVQKFFSTVSDTADDVRRGLVETLKLGLLSYVARTPIARRLVMDYAPPAKVGPVRDRWNSWVFNLSSNGSFSGEESYSERYANFSFSANRVTPAFKVRLGADVGTSRMRYKFEDETIIGTRESYDASGLFVKSLGEHWSAGLFAEAESSLYSNTRLGLTAAPAVEFNAFPYAQSTRRQLRFLYKLGVSRVVYDETTIYDKTRETLVQGSLSVTLDLREKWGTISVSTTGSHYFHDFSKNRLNVFGMVSLNLYKGLSVFALGGASVIHDQLSLLQRDLTSEEILLRLREFPTQSDHFFSVGFQFTFGSIFTNVINPRFGSAGRGGIRIVMN